MCGRTGAADEIAGQMDEQFYNLAAHQRIALVREALDAGRALMIRRVQVAPNFGDQWHARAAAAAEWLATPTSIADLGCGPTNLERCLGQWQCYIPVDLARRDERTVFLDLNNGADLTRLLVASGCALLGVLEYIYGPDQLIAALPRRYDQVVATFNILRTDESIEDRLGHGWVNHFARAELLELFADHGFTLARDHVFSGKRREHVFDLRRAGLICHSRKYRAPITAGRAVRPSDTGSFEI